MPDTARTDGRRTEEQWWVDTAGWVQPARGVSGPPGQGQAAAAQVVRMRPMPCQRTAAELVEATVALLGRPATDARLALFRRGALLAMDWVHARTDRAPVSNTELPRPTLVEAVAEYAVAWQIATSPDDFMTPKRRGIGRIVAHGAEAYLLWYCFPEAPTPALLEPATGDAEVLALLGEVGGPATTGREVLPELPGTRVTWNAAGEVVIR
jgi:hypothetical protein